MFILKGAARVNSRDPVWRLMAIAVVVNAL
jgi:hypothetical protein